LEHGRRFGACAPLQLKGEHMSASGQGGVRAHLDFYETPAWTTDLLLEYLVAEHHFEGLSHAFDRAVDVGCGDGAITERLGRHFDEEKIVGIDVDHVRLKLAKQRSPKATLIKTDYLRSEASLGPIVNEPGAVFWISNPPYEKAKEFLERTLQLDGMKYSRKHETSEANFLVRLGFMASKKRRSWHDEHGGQMLILPRRPSFCHSFTCRTKDGGCGLKLRLSTSVTVYICPTCNIPMKLVRSDAADYCWLRYVIEDGTVTNEKTWDLL